MRWHVDFGERNSTLSTVDGHRGGIAESEVRAMAAPTFYGGFLSMATKYVGDNGGIAAWREVHDAMGKLLEAAEDTEIDSQGARLPGISLTDARGLFAELQSLAPREEYVPPPVQRRQEPTAGDLDLAELRRNPEALRNRLFELTGNPAMQEATLRSVREMPASNQPKRS
jgi:hypothetical protein